MWPRGVFHGQVVDGGGGFVVSHPRQRVGRGVRGTPDVGRGHSVTAFGGRTAILAGLLLGARQLTWLWAPYVNSYKRYVPGSWAPTAAVWGIDNRTCGFRLVGHGEGRRVECRIPGADVNPYLALAAVLAAGLYGVQQGLELPPPFEGNAYNAADVPRVPTTLVEAIDELAGSTIAAHAFGEDAHHHLLNSARQEWVRANQTVTDWELARNFERI